MGVNREGADKSVDGWMDGWMDERCCCRFGCFVLTVVPDDAEAPRLHPDWVKKSLLLGVSGAPSIDGGRMMGDGRRRTRNPGCFAHPKAPLASVSILR